MLTPISMSSVAFCHSHAATDIELATLGPLTKPRLPKKRGALAQVCGNDRVHVRPEGPGGIPEGAALTPAGPHLWRPPPPLGRGQNDGSVVGQISGAPSCPSPPCWCSIQLQLLGAAAGCC